MQAFTVAVATPTQLRPQQYTFAAIRGDTAVPAAATASTSTASGSAEDSGDRVTLSDAAGNWRGRRHPRFTAGSGDEPVSQDAAE